MATCFFMYRLFFEPLGTVVSLWCGILSWREFLFSIGLTLAAWGCLATIMFSRNFYYHTYISDLKDPKAANYIFNVGPALVWASVFTTFAVVYHYGFGFLLCCGLVGSNARRTDWKSYLLRGVWRGGGGDKNTNNRNNGNFVEVCCRDAEDNDDETATSRTVLVPTTDPAMASGVSPPPGGALSPSSTVAVKRTALGVLATLFLLGIVDAFCGAVATYANPHRHIFLQTLFVAALILWTFTLSRYLIPRERHHAPVTLPRQGHSSPSSDSTSLSPGRRTTTKTITLGTSQDNLDGDDTAASPPLTTTYRRTQISRKRRQQMVTETDEYGYARGSEHTRVQRPPWPVNSFLLILVAVIFAAVPHWIRNYTNAVLDAEEEQHSRHNKMLHYLSGEHTDGKNKGNGKDATPWPTPLPTTVAPAPTTPPSIFSRFAHRRSRPKRSLLTQLDVQQQEQATVFNIEQQSDNKKKKEKIAKATRGGGSNSTNNIKNSTTALSTLQQKKGVRRRLRDAMRQFKEYIHIAEKNTTQGDGIRGFYRTVKEQLQTKLRFLNEGRGRQYTASWFSNFEFGAAATYREFYDIRHVEVQWLLLYYVLTILFAALPSLWLVLQGRFMILSENIALELFSYSSSGGGQESDDDDDDDDDSDAAAVEEGGEVELEMATIANDATPPPTPTVALLSAVDNKSGTAVVPIDNGSEQKAKKTTTTTRQLLQKNSSSGKKTKKKQSHKRQRQLPPTAFGIKLVMWAGESLIALVCIQLMFPLDFFPWYHTASGAEAGIEALQRGALNILFDDTIRFYFVSYTFAFLFLRVIFGYLNRVSPTLCAFVFALYLPVHTLTLWLFPSWDVFNVKPHSPYHLFCFVLLLVAALLYLIHEAMYSETAVSSGSSSSSHYHRSICQSQTNENDGTEETGAETQNERKNKTKGSKTLCCRGGQHDSDGYDSEDSDDSPYIRVVVGEGGGGRGSGDEDEEEGYNEVLYEDDELIAAGFGAGVVHSSDEQKSPTSGRGGKRKRKSVNRKNNNNNKQKMSSHPHSAERQHLNGFSKADEIALMELRRQTMLSQQQTSDQVTPAEAHQKTTEDYYSDEINWLYRSVLEDRFRFRNYIASVTGCAPVLKLTVVPSSSESASAVGAAAAAAAEHDRNTNNMNSDPTTAAGLNDSIVFHKYLQKASSQEYVLRFSTQAQNECVGHWCFVTPQLIVGAVPLIKCHKAASYAAVQAANAKNKGTKKMQQQQQQKKQQNGSGGTHPPHNFTGFMSPDLSLLAQACAQRQVDRLGLIVSTQDLKEVKSIELRGHAVDVADWRRNKVSSSPSSSVDDSNKSDIDEDEIIGEGLEKTSSQRRAVARGMFSEVDFVSVPMVPHYFKSTSHSAGGPLSSSPATTATTDKTLVDEILTVCKQIHDVIGQNNQCSSSNATANKSKGSSSSRSRASAAKKQKNNRAAAAAAVGSNHTQAVYIQCTSGGDRATIVALCYLIYTGLTIQEAVDALTVLRAGRFADDDQSTHLVESSSASSSPSPSVFTPRMLAFAGMFSRRCLANISTKDGRNSASPTTSPAVVPQKIPSTPGSIGATAKISPPPPSSSAFADRQLSTDNHHSNQLPAAVHPFSEDGRETTDSPLFAPPTPSVGLNLSTTSYSTQGRFTGTGTDVSRYSSTTNGLHDSSFQSRGHQSQSQSRVEGRLQQEMSNRAADISGYIDEDISVRGLSYSHSRPRQSGKGRGAGPETGTSPSPRPTAHHNHSPIPDPSSFSPSPIPVGGQGDSSSATGVTTSVEGSTSIEAPTHSIAYSDTVYDTTTARSTITASVSQSQPGVMLSPSTHTQTAHNTTDPHAAPAQIIGLPGGASDDEEEGVDATDDGGSTQTPSPSPIPRETTLGGVDVNDSQVTITSPPTSSIPTPSNSATPQYASTVFTSETRASMATTTGGLRSTVGDADTTTGSFTEEVPADVENDATKGRNSPSPEHPVKKVTSNKTHTTTTTPPQTNAEAQSTAAVPPSKTSVTSASSSPEVVQTQQTKNTKRKNPFNKKTGQRK